MKFDGEKLLDAIFRLESMKYAFEVEIDKRKGQALTSEKEAETTMIVQNIQALKIAIDCIYEVGKPQNTSPNGDKL